ncbi:MAG TPA: ATP-binding protein [Dermatophilaceae bacterium]|nr:ATP-binding protein [Dermatophilaceae bacterium]
MSNDANTFLAMLEELRARGGDTTDVEVKLGAGGCPTLGPTLSAFGNLPTGGTIILGLDEARDFEPVGVPDPTALEAGIASQARNAVTPPVQVSFERVDVDGVVVVVASVSPLAQSARPCTYGGNAYLRQADGDYVMSDPEVQQILSMRDRPRFDKVPVTGSRLADLDPDLTSDYIAAVRGATRRLAGATDEEVLRHKGVVADRGIELTVAGLYALGAYPQQFAPSLSITAAVHLDPRTGARTRDLGHLDGPIPVLLDEAMAWVARNTRTTIRYDDRGHARDVEEIPAVAVRELVANSLVHRDLSPHTQGKRVEMRMTQDHLVISNPGGLWGINQAQLGMPAGKSAVNEFLYEICKLVRTDTGARVIEGEGGGIRDARRAITSANLQPPRFYDRGVSFTVLIPRHSLISERDVLWLNRLDPGGQLSEVQRRVAVSMRHGETWTNSQVRQEFAPLDSTVARTELQGLVTAGVATATGERGQTTYSLADTLALELPTTGSPRITVHPSPAPAASMPTLDPEPLAGPDQSVTRLAPQLWSGLAGGPTTLRDLVARTGLTSNQVRYALAKLVDHGWVEVNGGWGRRGTTYRRATPA